MITPIAAPQYRLSSAVPGSTRRTSPENAAAQRLSEQPGRGRKILVVEDEGIVAMDLRNLLIRLGYSVTGIAASGEQALRQATENRPDLVLMDIRLQGRLDGIATAEQLHARFGVPFIFLTAFVDDATLQRAQAARPRGILRKPFIRAELQDAVAAALSASLDD